LAAIETRPDIAFHVR